MSGLPFAITLATALGCGLVAGVFFAFSSFVMSALGRLPAAQGIAAMQSINVRAVTPAFMAALFGTGVACLGLAVWAVVGSGERPTAALLAGAGLYLVGDVAVTMAFNVPLNNALAAHRPDEPAAEELWRRYLRRWTAWNHVRAAAALGAAAALTLALAE